jgi:hypothetical protein
MSFGIGPERQGHLHSSVVAASCSSEHPEHFHPRDRVSPIRRMISGNSNDKGQMSVQQKPRHCFVTVFLPGEAKTRLNPPTDAQAANSESCYTAMDYARFLGNNAIV